MSDPGPLGDNPFQGLPFFGDLAKMLGGQGPLSWDTAKQFAMHLATGGVPEANVDPLERIRWAELARVADLHVAATTGLATSLTGRPVEVVPVTPSAWALRSLEAYRPLFELLATALGSGSSPGIDDDETGDPGAAMLAGLLAMVAPMMLGMSAGSMVGHLATRSFGQYDLPIPRPPSDELQVVATTVATFGNDWELPADDLRLYVSLSEITHHALLGVPHLRDELQRLISAYVGGFRPNPHALEEKLGGLELSDPSGLAGLQQAFADPEVLLGAAGTPEQEATATRLDALVAVLVGVVDHTMDTIGHRLIASYPRLTEAVRRRRVEADEGDRFVARLLGLRLTQDQVERGQRFVSGVVERAGEDGLARLYRSARELPTPNEVNAPGLWLARIDLPD